MKKIVLDAGHGIHTSGKQTPNGVKEWTLNDAVARQVTTKLKDYEVEVHRIDDTTGKTDISLTERINRTNKIMPDVMISIHHNALAGKWDTHTGVEIYYNNTRGNATEKILAKNIVDKLAANTKLKNRGVKTEQWAVLTCNTKITALLTEGGFMDSTIDHPVITSTSGQTAYAKAIADTLIKHLGLKKKTTTTSGKSNTTSNQTTNKNLTTGSKYTLTKATPGYYTAADAKNGKNKRVTVAAGDYTIFNQSGGMINITQAKGVPGSWINPNVTTRTSSNASNQTTNKNLTTGSKYTLTKATPGYYTAADAKNGRNKRVTVATGNYLIFNQSGGMINISKTKGVPGSWINPTKQ